MLESAPAFPFVIVRPARDPFGTNLANGEEAAAFRIQKIDPIIASGEKVVLDFSGVRSANSSFMNALVSGVVQNHGAKATESIIFKGCNPVIRVLVESAIDLRMQKAASKAA